MAVFEGAGLPFRMVDRPIEPRPGRGECLVEIALTTICGSDLHLVTGRRSLPTPSVLGHEALVGLVHPGSHLNLTVETIIRICLTFQGTHNYAPRHLPTAVDALTAQATRHPWDSLVSPPYPLENIDEASAAARAARWPRVSLRPGPDRAGS